MNKTHKVETYSVRVTPAQVGVAAVFTAWYYEDDPRVALRAASLAGGVTLEWPAELSGEVVALLDSALDAARGAADDEHRAEAPAWRNLLRKAETAITKGEHE